MYTPSLLLWGMIWLLLSLFLQKCNNAIAVVAPFLWYWEDLLSASLICIKIQSLHLQCKVLLIVFASLLTENLLISPNLVLWELWKIEYNQLGLKHEGPNKIDNS